MNEGPCPHKDETTGEAFHRFRDGFCIFCGNTNFPVPVLADAETRSQEGETAGEARESTRGDRSASSDESLAIDGHSRGGGNAGGNTPATLYEKNTNQDEASKRQNLWTVFRAKTEEKKQETVEGNPKESNKIGPANGGSAGEANQARQVRDLQETNALKRTARPSHRLLNSNAGGMAMPRLPSGSSSTIGGGENNLSGGVESRHAGHQTLSVNEKSPGRTRSVKTLHDDNPSGGSAPPAQNLLILYITWFNRTPQWMIAAMRRAKCT